MLDRIAAPQPLSTDMLAARGPLRHWPRTSHWPSLTGAYDMSAVPAPALLVEPALWIGVAFAIVMILGASRLRRRQRPL